MRAPAPASESGLYGLGSQRASFFCRCAIPLPEKVGLGGRLAAIATTHLLCGRYHAPMWRSQLHPDLLSLEVCAERAGAALACEYANSTEFDAALIAARRAAGVYGPKRHRRRMLVTAAGIAAGLVVVAFLFV